MKKIAIFGKPGGGKSTLASKFAAETGINLYALDLIEYKENGEKISHEDFSKQHADLIANDCWIIEGLGPIESFWLRIDAADTLIYVDLPYVVHYWWVAKRLLKSLFKRPEGWPEGSSVFKGTLASLKYLRLSPNFWNEKLLTKIHSHGNGKMICHITSVQELNAFLRQVRH